MAAYLAVARCCCDAYTADHAASPCYCWQVLSLQHVEMIAPEAYPRFTLVRQAWGSLLLGLEALRLMVPEVNCCCCCCAGACRIMVCRGCVQACSCSGVCCVALLL
jgi:hypothetical protein